MFEYSFWSFGSALQEYGVILPQGDYKVPKNGKMCPKIAIFRHVSPFLGTLEAP